MYTSGLNESSPQIIIYDTCYDFRFQKSIASKCQKRLKNPFRERNAKKCQIKDAKISQSMSQEKSVKSSPRLSALKIQSMSKRKYPRSIVSRYPRRFVTPSHGSSSRMCPRKLARRCVTAPRWTRMVTPAPMWSPPMITSRDTRPRNTSLRLRPQITRLRLRATAPRPPPPATALQTSTAHPKPPRPRVTAPRPPPTTATRD